MALKQVFSHTLADLFFDEDKSYFEERWKAATEHATDEDFMTYQYEKIEVAKGCLPKFFLCDTRDFKYVITVDMQAWTDQIVMGFWDSTPLKKLAFIVSSEFIAQLAVEQAMSENPHEYPIHYFDSESDALAWLFEEKV
jgi:hypothetical protein